MISRFAQTAQAVELMPIPVAKPDTRVPRAVVQELTQVAGAWAPPLPVGTYLHVRSRRHITELADRAAVVAVLERSQLTPPEVPAFFALVVAEVASPGDA